MILVIDRKVDIGHGIKVTILDQDLIGRELPYYSLGVMFYEHKSCEGIDTHISSDIFDTQSFAAAHGIRIRTSCNAYRVDSASAK